MAEPVQTYTDPVPPQNSIPYEPKVGAIAQNQAENANYINPDQLAMIEQYEQKQREAKMKQMMEQPRAADPMPYPSEEAIQ